MNLFKLKHEDKTVGYMRIQGGILQGSFDCSEWRYITNQNPAGDLKLNNDKWIHFFDEALPYVCEDKNGDKVFAGDEVKHNDFDDGAGTVEPFEISGIFQGWTVEFYFPEDTERTAARIGDSKDIELIKEQA